MRRLKQVLLYLMAVFYVFAGYMHFAKPDFYMPMMPPYLPWHAELVFLSGVAEVICGIGLLFPATRQLAAWATIALLIAVFPANL
ncbi:MAG TPA: DoxX family protein, partial [Candidatus Acidoferrales bacterium]|nr:DoxX family protein [Candidatus Acidoferrales bacterium]